MATFERNGIRLYFSERGRCDGPPLVLTHGLLWSSPMQERLASLLPDNRVLLLDLHGHGRSDKPADPAAYTWDEMAADVVALLDHAGIERAAVGGLSLGANVTLAVAHRYASRVAAMVLEMPVLSRGHDVGRIAFGTLATVFERGAGPLGVASRLIRRMPVPGSVPDLEALRDVAGVEPRVARAILRGLIEDDPVSEDPAALAGLTMPALVIGHRHDPLHVLQDARDLSERLPNARLVVARSILTHRVMPARLARVTREFLAAVDA